LPAHPYPVEELRMSFVYVWEYEVREDVADEFERVYSPGGEWTALFERSDAYVRTELHRDADDPCRYVTFDYWESRDERDAFRAEFAAEFEELDSECESLTEAETFIGDFETVAS
jgi:hypothetical protein